MHAPAEEPYYVTTIPVPTDLDQVTPVDISLPRVELRVERLQSASAANAGTALFKIQRHEPERAETDPYQYFNRRERESEVVIGQSGMLTIQSDAYDFEVLAPGTEKFAGTFTIGNETPPIIVRLKPGGDVHFEVVRPDGERGARFSLFAGGKKLADDYFDYKTNTYRGLPVGNYTLHISSSAEDVAENGGEEGAFVPLKGYEGRNIPFTVIGNATEVLDLGEIRLEPASN